MTQLNLQHPTAELAAQLQGVSSAVAICGAGISAESGISTFRGTGGYWNRYRAEELASPEGFQRDPALVWRWYNERRQAILNSQPNPGHHALVDLHNYLPSFQLITQNVDGLHQQAGSPQVLELHGSIWNVRCTSDQPHTADQGPKQWTDRNVYSVTELPLRCACGQLARPGVLWFGESYDPALIQRAQKAVAQTELVLVIGTSGLVWIVSGLLQSAQRALVLEFNLETSELTREVDSLVAGPAGQTLPALVRLMQAR